MTWARLTFRLQPSSIGFVALVCLGLAVLTLNLPSMLAECGSRDAPDNCRVIHLFGSPLGDAVGMTYVAIGLAMYAVPLVLGVPILTSEIERRTAMIAWSLSASRMRWLAWRAGSVLVVGLLLIGLMALAAEWMAAADAPDTDLGFAQHGARGISLMTRAGLMFAASLAVGAARSRSAFRWRLPSCRRTAWSRPNSRRPRRTAEVHSPQEARTELPTARRSATTRPRR